MHYCYNVVSFLVVLTSYNNVAQFQQQTTAHINDHIVEHNSRQTKRNQPTEQTMEDPCQLLEAGF